jgi:hypothetical protein
MRAKSNQTLARPTIESYSIEWSAQAIPPEGSIQIFNEYARAPLAASVGGYNNALRSLGCCHNVAQREFI